MLIYTRRFLPLFVTQFLGAFNDNLLKNSLVLLITYRLTEDAASAQILVTIAAGVFILPFFIFSSLAGQVADKFERSQLTRIIKLFEIFIMLFAIIGLMLQSTWLLITALFAAGVHSTFFGPIKYALLPQHLHADELLTGNAYIEAGTFLAILLGTIGGGLIMLQQYGTLAVTFSLLVVAITGYIASCYILRAPAPMPSLRVNYNIVTETIKLIRYARMNRIIMLTIFGISWFWFVGATFLAQISTFVKIYLHAEAKVVTLFLTIFSIGIAVGSFICTCLLKGAIKSTYVPIAAFVMSLFIFDLYLSSTNEIFFNLHGLYSIQRFLHLDISLRIMFDLFCIAVAGGIYIVPLYTIMQYSADKKYMARIIAANNVFNALFMVLAVIFTLSMLTLKRTIPEVFLIIGCINLLFGWFLQSHLHRT